MMNSLQQEPICPRFISKAKKNITCIGLLPHTEARIIFTAARDAETHFMYWCCARFTYCEMYAAGSGSGDRREEKKHVDPLEEANQP